ncbi:MAG: universal stress protein [Acidobacteriaceae bacterium]|nr:universal stress protein [Acidobacteriaceae bacterium]
MHDKIVSASIPKKILLPIDFSPSSYAALEIAAGLAQDFSAKIYLFNVIHLPPTVSDADFLLDTEMFQEAERNAEESLAACDAKLTAKNIAVTHLVEARNDVVVSILEEIKREHIDMLILSTHGMSGWRPLVFGSVTEKLIRVVECPLLLLRSAK